MTKSYFPFDAGAGANVTESQWRKMGRFWLQSGPIYGSQAVGLLNFQALQPYGDSSGRQVKVRAGAAWVRGHYYENDAEETIALAANASGNPRIDRVVVRADFTANTIDTVVIQGTPAASPSAPAITQSTTVWDVPLAQVAVANGAATITAANVTDERDLAVPSHVSVGAVASLAAGTTSDLVEATNSAVPFDTEELDTDGFHSTVTEKGRLTVPAGLGGLYVVTGTIVLQNNNTDPNDDWFALIRKNGATIGSSGDVSQLGGGTDVAFDYRHGVTVDVINDITAMSMSAGVYLAAGDWLQLVLQFRNTGTATARDFDAGSRLSLIYQGRPA